MTVLNETDTPVLLLWDIDHTLIENNGVSKEIYVGAFELITGQRVVTQPFTEGRTDPEIMRDLFIQNGIQFTSEVEKRLPGALVAAMSSHASSLRVRGAVLPGITDALAALDGYPQTVQSIVTGNIHQNALAKLDAFGLDPFFDLEVGGYGSDAPDRSLLVNIARKRAREKYGDVCIIVIGDTPRDIQAGLAGDSYTVGVATGVYSTVELQAEGADATFQDLSNTTGFLDIISRLRDRSSSRATAETGMVEGEVIDSSWAYQMAERHLEPLGNRWKHVEAVGEQARRLSQALSEEESELLVTSALLHDIGYSSDLVITGFHPLDGARWLRSVGASPRLCSLVAHHSCAVIEAAERGLKDDLEAEFNFEQSPLSDALTCADMTVGPDGSLLSVEARLAEILVRYPPSHVVHIAISRAAPFITGAVRRSEARLNSIGRGAS